MSKLDNIGRALLERPLWLAAVVIVSVLGLPLVVWLDLEEMSETSLYHQAQGIHRIVDAMQEYYTDNVISRVDTATGQVLSVHNFRDVPNAIPIPQTMAIELGKIISAMEGGADFRFVSDEHFGHRTSHKLTDFEERALAHFREDPEDHVVMVEHTGNLLDHGVVMATPVLMEGPCVTCHNSHPESPKHDWKVGDVRGLQVISVTQPVTLGIWSFRFILIYILVAGTLGAIVATLQYRLAKTYSGMNAQLADKNAFLAQISTSISKYLPPQVYRSIFAGERDASISTERKKLTVFFSDIKDFTSTTEGMQPEDLTQVLNEYFTEMTRIAAKHGATIDKFIGDAIVAFFGDPTTMGVAEDARACVRMGLEMQARMLELEHKWHDAGFTRPFRIRIGINTGYCNVGNFGSNDRMDYTIIGAEVNLAARLESLAEPGGIVMSSETYGHVRDFVPAASMAEFDIKGITRKVRPYRVEMDLLHVKRAPYDLTDGGTRLVINLTEVDPDLREKLQTTVTDILAEDPQKDDTPRTRDATEHSDSDA
ncbi:adenylate/guanylate cyclase domain-containing protein [Chachezhania antarctica]|uniref:adenylate/guanylate cyclase domain-containing protein n=1 Tax=Chachezhania antarctica TaxID=2340860 RepID=UPI0013CEF3DF|nr:adenylate/guanylate cyclase domain-containing protein [Chachezhania antarctica]|tara:strand:+ start:2250 stop:3866 length:1617 start_codon:yes stop_codon:yes gene_type:complete